MAQAAVFGRGAIASATAAVRAPGVDRVRRGGDLPRRAMPILPSHRGFTAVLVFAVAGLAQQQAMPGPSPLWTAIANPPAAAVQWDAAERAQSPMVAQATFVRLDTAALAAIPARAQQPLATFALDLPGAQATWEVTSQDWVLGHRTFVGHVPGRTSTVQLAVAADGTTWGQIDIDALTWVVAPTGVGDVHVLQRIDHSLLPPHMGCGTDHTHAVAAAPVGGADLGTNSDCSVPIVDVIVFYTPLARQNAGGIAAIEAAIVGAVQQSNLANRDSGVGMAMRLVRMAETNYAELGTNTDLSRFRANNDGFMDEVFAARDTYGGDLMHLITNPASASYCGIAYLMTSLSTGFASSAFGITVRTCIPGRTFTHECGHNMACHHDIANAGAALYPYSYGHRTPDNAYRTIMAYAPGTRINRWSSPNVSYLGYTMGTATADNAQSLDNTAATVSQFWATRAPVWCDLAGGVGGALGMPTITGSGTVNLAQPLQATVRNFAPGALGVLVIGASAINAPIFGATLVPTPDVTVTLIGVGQEIVYGCNWLASLPAGAQVWFQAGFLDASASGGLAASDAVRVTVP